MRRWARRSPDWPYEAKEAVVRAVARVYGWVYIAGLIVAAALVGWWLVSGLL